MIETSFAEAKEMILGRPPENEKARIGYNVAKGYFENLIEDAEKILFDMQVPKTGFATYLRNAFTFASYEAFQYLDKEAFRVIEKSTERFRERYEPLLNALELKAA